MASENGVKAEDTQESDNDTEHDSQETESSSPETSTTFHSKRPTITTRFVLYAITRFSRAEIT